VEKEASGRGSGGRSGGGNRGAEETEMAGGGKMAGKWKKM
jgi:hypothetical protein